MRGSLDEPPIVLRRRRLNTVILTVAPLILGLISIFIFGRGAGSPSGIPLAGPIAGPMVWAALPVVLLLPLIVRAWGLHFSSYLEIGPDGLTEKVGRRVRIYPWSKVVRFRVFNSTRPLRENGVRFDCQLPPTMYKEWPMEPLELGEDGLWTGWEMGAEPLSKLLNLARRVWGPR
jgi:hypothetical protein